MNILKIYLKINKIKKRINNGESKEKVLKEINELLEKIKQFSIPYESLIFARYFQLIMLYEHKYDEFLFASIKN